MLAALVLPACPEIIPGSTLGQVFCGGLRGMPVDTACLFLVAADVFLIPAGHGIFLDDLLLGVLCLDDGGCQDATAEHKLIGHVPHLLVGSKVAEQRAQVALVVGGHLSGDTIYIR